MVGLTEQRGCLLDGLAAMTWHDPASNGVREGSDLTDTAR